MGMGDVKLAAFVGLAVGFALTAPAMLIMAISGGVIATMLLLTGLRKKGVAVTRQPADNGASVYRVGHGR